jgi:hypothetical protein
MIEWIQWDIANTKMLNNIKQYLDKRGSIDFILHLAEFYNFDYKDKLNITEQM